MKNHALGFKGEELSASTHRNARPWCKLQCVPQGTCGCVSYLPKSQVTCGHHGSTGCVAGHLLPVCPAISALFPGGSPTPPDNHLRVTTTLFFFYKTLLQGSVSWQTHVGDSLVALGRGGTLGSLQLERFSLSLKLADSNHSSWTQFPPCRVGQLGQFHDNAVFSLLTAQVLGPCHRCQMICIDQQTGQRNQDVFQKLSERRERKVSMVAKYNTPS